MSEHDKTSLTLRLPVTLRERIQKAAKADHRNESQFIRVQLEKILERGPAKKRRTA